MLAMLLGRKPIEGNAAPRETMTNAYGFAILL
jgi:hypothetical protein